MLTTDGILLVSALCVNVTMVFSFFIWCCALLHRHWKQQYFIKRRPILVLWLLISSLGLNGIGVISSFQILATTVASDSINLSNLTITIIYETFHSIFYGNFHFHMVTKSNLVQLNNFFPQTLQLSIIFAKIRESNKFL